MSEYLSALAAIIWLITALLPWQPWRVREGLEIDKLGSIDLSDVTVVIPRCQPWRANARAGSPR